MISVSVTVSDISALVLFLVMWTFEVCPQQVVAFAAPFTVLSASSLGYSASGDDQRKLHRRTYHEDDIMWNVQVEVRDVPHVRSEDRSLTCSGVSIRWSFSESNRRVRSFIRSSVYMELHFADLMAFPASTITSSVIGRL